MFFEKYTEKVWGRRPAEISADWGTQRIKGLSILKIIKNQFYKDNQKKETSLIEQFWYPKYGPGQLWENMAEEIKRKGRKNNTTTLCKTNKYRKQINKIS